MGATDDQGRSSTRLQQIGTSSYWESGHEVRHSVQHRLLSSSSPVTFKLLRPAIGTNGTCRKTWLRRRVVRRAPLLRLLLRCALGDRDGRRGAHTADSPGHRSLTNPATSSYPSGRGVRDAGRAIRRPAGIWNRTWISQILARRLRY